jgi:hypothetical protein
MSAKLLKVAGIVLVIHGVIELLAILSLVTGQPPPFVFQELKENWQYAILIGLVAGAIRIIAAVGVFKSMKWGLALGIAMSIITHSTLAFYLPYGIMDALLAGIVLVLLVMAYWGKEKMVEED